MKKVLLAVSLWALAGHAWAKPYLHPGFNQVAGGAFYPIAGGVSGQQAGLIMPVLEHDAEDGYLIIPGVNWHPLNLGYVGKTSNLHDFLAGSLALGPSAQVGETAKTALRSACAFLVPSWDSPDRFTAAKALLAPGQTGMYADIGIYAAVPINKINYPSKIQPQLLIGVTLNKRW